MRKGLCIVAILLVLGVYLCAPVFESVDHWDQGPLNGNDIVLNLTAVAFCLGAALAVAHLIRILFRACGTALLIRISPKKCEERLVIISRSSLLLTSPPALRI